jgi:hypothetical protein
VHIYAHISAFIVVIYIRMVEVIGVYKYPVVIRVFIVVAILMPRP